MKLWEITKNQLLPVSCLEVGGIYISNLGNIYECVGKDDDGKPNIYSVLPGKDRTQPSTLFDITAESDGVEAFTNKVFNINSFLINKNLTRLLFNMVRSYLKLSHFQELIDGAIITDSSKLHLFIEQWENTNTRKRFRPI